MSLVLAGRPRGQPAYSSHTRTLVAERLLVAGLRAQERAEESEAARSRLAFLFNASQRLAASLEPATVLHSLVEQIVPEFGDGAIVHLGEAGGRNRPATTAAADVLKDCPREWWDWVARVTRPAVKRGLGRGLSEIGLTGRRGAQPVSEGGELAFMVVPLRARGHTLGTLSIVSRATRQRYGPEDLAVAEALGNQAGLAFDNAELYDEQRRMVQRLEEVRSQLDVAQSESLREDERRRIARDLHDHVEQTFFAIGLTATAALEGQNGHSMAASIDALARVSELSTAGAEQLRAAIFALNHTEFAGLGLTPALWKLVRSFQQRTGIDTDLVLTGSQRPVAVEVAEALYATAREALTNVERHARAGAVVLGLHVSARSITLTVHDDGNGAPHDVLKRMGASAIHFGLRGLRERVRRLHGTFSSGSGPDGGFVVRARIPLHAAGDS